MNPNAVIQKIDPSLTYIDTFVDNEERPVYVVDSPNGKAVLKVGLNNNPFVKKELEDTQVAQGIVGIPDLYREYQLSNGIAFLKRYVEGHVLASSGRITDPKKSELLRRTLEMLYSRNVYAFHFCRDNLVDDGKIIHLVDLGPIAGYETFSKERFIKANNQELERMIGK